LDLSPMISELRGSGVRVDHIFHKEDIVPGAEVESIHSTVFDGRHFRIAHEPEPVAAHISNMAMDMLDLRRLSPQEQFGFTG
jgi:hypothetical protein